MIHKIVSIYDIKAMVYSKPLYFPSYAAAIRSFADAVKDEKSDYMRHPEDYIMFGFGEFNDVKGTFDITLPEELVKALSLVGE